MLHGPLTLLMRSVRADALKQQPHLIRLVSVLVILLFLISAHQSDEQQFSPGIMLFQSIAYLAIGLLSLAAIGHFCNAITEEKEEGTLGLLLMANISPLGILLGKSTNRIFSVALIFVAMFPFALLAITLGGITVSQIAATFLALAGYLFLVANLGLMVSVWSPRSQVASAAMVALLLLMHFVPTGLAQFFRNVSAQTIDRDETFRKLSDSLFAFHDQTSVVARVQHILEPFGDDHFLSWQLYSSLIVGSIAFLIAWVSFRQILWAPEMDQPGRVTTRRKSRWFTLLVPRPWPAALVWKDYFFLTGGWSGMALRVAFYSLLTLIVWTSGPKLNAFFKIDSIELFRDLMLVLLAVEILYLASQFFHLERRAGTLPTLFMLPRSPAWIAFQKLLGCLLGLVPTVTFLVLSEQIFTDQTLAKPIVFSRQMLIYLSGLLVLSHLTVLFSLIVRWGALPLAMGVSLLCWFLLLPFLLSATSIISRNDPGVISEASPLIYGTVVLCGAIQFEIFRRLDGVVGS